MTEKLTPKNIVITAHPKIPEAMREATLIAGHLQSLGFSAPSGSLYDEKLRRRVKDKEFDLLFAVGGDGTMLRAAHLCAPVDVPILGVNHGKLGFLFQVFPEGWKAMLEALLKGEGWIENRMMLLVEHFRSGELLGSWHALNDAVVSRGQIIRPVHITASVDGLRLTTYVADGLIASTATGSTAYALAAGGPILPPALRNILIVPIAPHLSVDRALVLSQGSSVRITIHSENGVLSVDGQIPIGLAEEDHVDIRAGNYASSFVRFGDAGYFYRNLIGHMNQNPAIGSHT